MFVISQSSNSKICIKVAVTEPLGTSCRKLIYNAGVVADKLGIELEIIKNKSTGEGEDEQLPPPFILFDELVIGKDISIDKLEQVIQERMRNMSDS